ncbi:MAG: dephospho-CoA kinase [Firmicutes bacterium]|nr:dephospho-CoA kinase [Bacillota bacterium]
MSLTVGLTGGIASGKSVVAQIFRQKGAKLIDADQIAREIVEPGEPALEEIAATFGQEVLTESGELNRRALAEKVFGNQAALRRLNRITHPRILRVIRRRVVEYRKAGAQIIVIDAPLLIETGLQKLVDKVVVVSAPEEVQIKRLRQRDGLSRKEALARIHSQMPAKERERWADYIIRTDCPFPQVVAQAEKVWEEIKRDQESRPDST